MRRIQEAENRRWMATDCGMVPQLPTRNLEMILPILIVLWSLAMSLTLFAACWLARK